MTQSKNTILIIVVLILFTVSGIVLYRGFFQDTAGDLAGLPGAGTTQKEIVNLLPYGTTLDFGKVQTRSAETNTFTYASVDPGAVGVDIHALISPGASLQPGQVSPSAGR